MKMCSASCTIELENTDGFYRPGEEIIGLVNLDINCTNYILIKALSLQFSGYAYTKWKTPTKARKLAKPRPTALIECREDFVSTTSYLIGSEMANAKRFEPGIYTYNFMTNIPQNTPSTFDSPLGFIRYEFTVNADYGDHTRTLCNIPVAIKQLKDLRQLDPSLQLPVETQQFELKCLAKFWQQPLSLFISIPQAAFTAGECISLHIKLTNHSKLKIQTITANLNRIVTYKERKRDTRSDTTTEKNTIAANLQNLYGQSQQLTQLLLEIVVPKTPPTITSDECKCINLSYELEVVATSQNKHRLVRATVPVLIGSVSLRSDAKMLPPNSNNQNVAAIRVAKSVEDLTLTSAMDLQHNLSTLQTTNTSASMGSLASSLQEANFMTAIQLNKKSRKQIVGDSNRFKPKYLYYDSPEAGKRHLQNDISSPI